MLTHGSLFTGYGGLDMAVEEIFNAKTVWVSDIDNGILKILGHRFPSIKNIGDISKVDWNDVEPVDIISGGSPCQDISSSGKLLGMTEGTRSNMWVEMRRAIQILKPKYIVWESVHGVLSSKADSGMEYCEGCMGNARNQHALQALGRVLGDLASIGYDAEWRGIRASAVGAPHMRKRIFLVAKLPNAHIIEVPSTYVMQPNKNKLIPTPRAMQWQNRNNHIFYRDPKQPQNLENVLWYVVPGLNGEDAFEKNSSGQYAHINWGKFYNAINHWEQVTGRTAPPPVEFSHQYQGYKISAAFVEWMMGLPAGWVTAVPEITRSESLKALGNGVIPQQAKLAISQCLEGFN